MTELEQCALSRKYSSQHRASIIDLDNGIFALMAYDDRLLEIGSWSELELAFHHRPIPVRRPTLTRTALVENLFKELGL